MDVVEEDMDVAAHRLLGDVGGVGGGGMGVVSNCISQRLLGNEVSKRVVITIVRGARFATNRCGS